MALLHDEPGSDLVAEHIEGALLSTANLAEVVGKVVDADLEVVRFQRLIAAAGVSLHTP